MPTWAELETQFRELTPPMRFIRLDYQWGAAGTYYRLAGGAPNASTLRFEALSAIAGEALADLPTGNLNDLVSMRRVPLERWYEALRHHSGLFENGFVGRQIDEAGNNRGSIYTGTIQNPTEASALLALRFSAIRPVPARIEAQAATSWIERVNARITREYTHRRALWALIGFLILAALAAAALAA